MAPKTRLTAACSGTLIQLSLVWSHVRAQNTPRIARRHAEAIARSPAWHRRTRGLRHRARLRVRGARLQGKPSCKADLVRLALHHSRPCYRELDYMGKQGWHQGGRGQSAWDSHSSQQAWRWKGQRGDPKKDGGMQIQKSGYRDVPIKGETPTLTAKKRSGGGGGHAYGMPRAEQVLGRRRRKKRTCKQQWENYARLMKEAFLAERVLQGRGPLGGGGQQGQVQRQGGGDEAEERPPEQSDGVDGPLRPGHGHLGTRGCMRSADWAPLSRRRTSRGPENLCSPQKDCGRCQNRGRTSKG